LILWESLAMALAIKLLIVGCIKSKFIGSKTSVLPYQVSAVSPASNVVHCTWSGTRLHAPKPRTSLVILCGQKIICLCTFI
jgi:hypothetical protein